MVSHRGSPQNESEEQNGKERGDASFRRPLAWRRYLAPFVDGYTYCDQDRVRVHSDPAAEQSAQDIHARAYTVGHDIVFAAGQFAPGRVPASSREWPLLTSKDWMEYLSPEAHQQLWSKVRAIDFKS